MAATGAADALMKKGDKAATPGLFKFKSDWVGAGAAYEQAALKYRLAKAHAQAAHAYEKAADAQEKQGESRRAGAGRTSAHKVGGSCRADLRHACVFPPARPPARAVMPRRAVPRRQASGERGEECKGRWGRWRRRAGSGPRCTGRHAVLRGGACDDGGGGPREARQCGGCARRHRRRRRNASKGIRVL